MTSPYGIAAVTALLESKLTSAVEDLSNVSVSTLAPDQIDAGAQEDQLNLFLCRATPNPGWRNNGFPSHDARGERISNPPLGLDLHYLVTAYGTTPLQAEILLGHAMHSFHDDPVPSRESIRKALEPSNGTNGLPAKVSSSRLAEQLEQVKITLEASTSDEISKLWPAFQASYRLTAAYLVTVVLLETEKSVRSALPVRAAGLHVHPYEAPFIDRVEAASGPGHPIVAGASIRIVGRAFRADGIELWIGARNATAGASVSDERIELPVPTGLRAGAQTVRILRTIEMGAPPAPHKGFQSNVAAFALQPMISNPSAAATTISVDFEPPVERRQGVRLLLNETPAPSDRAPRSYSLAAPPGNGVPAGSDTTSTIAFATKGVAAGSYLLRAEVDGATSPLTADAAGVYVGPKVTLP